MERDVMSSATEELRLRRAIYRRETIRSPGSRAFDDAGMYLVESGRANIGFELAIAAGDLVLVPRGEAHVIEARTPSVDIVAARFEFAVPDHPLLQTLPAMVHIPAARLEASSSWSRLRANLLAELDHAHPGRETMLVRLSDVVLIEAMRHAPPPKGTECPLSGITGGVPDEGLRRVLRAIHDQPATAWTVASLADLAGQSRSAFAAHFASVMNEPPMSYLGRWRMFRARALLRDGELSVEQIAACVGYGSAAAFSLAFTREHGIAPGAFRRDALAC